jgi:PAS domain S-box-containing protein
MQGHFAAIVESTADAIIAKDLSGTVTIWNKAAELIFGYSASEMEGEPINRLLPSDRRDEETAILAQIRRGERIDHFETVRCRKDGSEFPVSLTISPILGPGGDIIGASKIARDITERKIAEAKIQQQANLHAALSQCNKAIVFCTTVEDLFQQICLAAVQIGGMKMAWIGITDPKTLIVRPLASFGDGAEYLRGVTVSVDPDSPWGQGPTGIAIREDRPFWCQDFLNAPNTALWRERGAPYGFRASASLPLHRQGGVIGAFTLYSGEANSLDEAVRDLLIEMATNISFGLDNIARVSELSRSEEQLKHAQRLAQMGSICVNLQTEETDWSDEVYRIFGVSRETFVPSKDSYLRAVHPDDQATVRAIQEHVRKAINPRPAEYRVIRPDGTVRWIYRESEVIRVEAGDPLYVNSTIQDITDRHRTEEQLRQSQKMEAIGNLTGGMAHDFNNLLGVIVGNLGLARERLGSDEELQEIVGEALEAAWRGADLTRSLLAFARRQPLRPARIDINELVSNTVRLLQRLLGEDIDVSLNLAERVWPVMADPAQLEASLANLATNARDAMPKGGRLIITTANGHLDAEYAAAHTDVTPGDFAMIEISDTGSGMSAEIANQIFEPFFTTKEPGKGTGLGLSMVFGFMRQSGGHINVYSEPGAGTTFRLYLPRAAAEAAERDVADAAPAARGTGETVLVVEDNLAMRRVVLRQLRELGYRVLECDHAAAALELLEREPVDLLLTDIVMPGGLDGVELARLARERWPALKVVLTSGFPQARVNGNHDVLGNLPLLSKPYSKDELAGVLRAALDG